MAEVKWIKIVTDIFDDEKMLFIEQLPETDSIIVIWFKLLTLSGKINNGGVLLFRDNFPYTDEMLSTVFRRQINIVRLALKTFEEFGMVEIINNAITIPNWSRHQSLEQLESRKKYMKNYMRDYREKQKMLAEGKVNSKVNSKHNGKANVSEADIEGEGDIEGDRDIEEDEEESSAGTTLFDMNFELIVNTFNQNIHPITPIEAEKSQAWLDDGMESSVIIAAIEESVTYNKRSLGYIEAILRNWHSKNINTKLDLDAYMRDRQDQAKEGGSDGSVSGDAAEYFKQNKNRFLYQGE